jgi:hypothetical protein
MGACCPQGETSPKEDTSIKANISVTKAPVSDNNAEPSEATSKAETGASKSNSLNDTYVGPHFHCFCTQIGVLLLLGVAGVVEPSSSRGCLRDT